MEPLHVGPAGRPSSVAAAKTPTRGLVSVALRSLSPVLQRRFDPFRATRVGEATNPGPAGLRRTRRKAKAKDINIGQLLGLLQQLLKMLGGNGAQLAQLAQLAKLLHPGTAEVRSEVTAPPAPAPRKVTLGSPQVEPAPVPAAPTPGPEWQEVRRRKQKPAAQQGDPARASGEPPAPEPSPSAKPSPPKPAPAAALRLRPQDWDSEILSLAQLYAKLDAKTDAVKAVVLATTQEQLEELCTAVAAHANLRVAVMAVTFGDWKWTRHAAEQADHTSVNLQALMGTATVTRKARLHQLGAQNCPKLKQITRKATGVAKPATTEVLRFITDARFVSAQAWAELRTKPAHSIRAWAAAHIPTDVLAVKDMWGFKVAGDVESPRAVLSGLVRVQADKVPMLLALSGRDRWFVSKPGSKDAVSWIKRGTDELHQDYLDRVYAQCKGRGVARGDTSLGVRLTAEEAASRGTVEPIRTYKVWPVPRDWSQETLEHELEQFKMQNLTFLARHPCKGGVKFLYRAKAADVDLAVIEHDKGAIQVVMQHHAPRRGNPVPIKAGRGAFTAPPVQHKPIPAPVPPPAEASQSAAPAEGHERPAAQPAPAKRLAVGAPAPRVHALPEGLTRVSNPGQGDCLFYALEKATGTNKLALRSAICAHLRRHELRYRACWNCLAPTKEDTPLTEFQEYLDALAKPGAWTSLLEVHAAARHLDRPVLIFSDVMPLQVCNRSGKAGQPIMLWYQSAHYELVEGTVPPDALATAIDAQKSGCKGGSAGPDKASDCGFTRASAFTGLTRWTAPAKGQLSLHQSFARATASSCATPVPALSQDSASAVTGLLHVTVSANPPKPSDVANLADLDDCIEPEPSVDAPVQGRKTIRRVVRTEWTCPICQWCTGHRVYWSQAKSDHIARWHPHLHKVLRCIAQRRNPAFIGPLQPDRHNAVRRRAAKVRSSAAVSRHMQAVKAYDGSHEIARLRIPKPPQATHTKTGKRIKPRVLHPPAVVCVKCTRKAATVQALAALPCLSQGVGGPKRAQLLARMLALVEDDAVPVEDREQAATVFRVLSPPQAAPVRPHSLRRYVWPLGPGPAAFCVVCLRVARKASYLKNTSCPGHVVWSARRHSACAALRAALPHPHPGRDTRIRNLLSLLDPAAPPVPP